ncbi:MAG: glycoside hydrolase family 25 protein, partial [Lachnospiraceae bacterium]|nr:glycoside hydrolase family 25 protein [Lachnospiraceae bacterium]
MKRGNRSIWLIPALIIGFNCLAFMIILILGMNREKIKNRDRTETVSENGTEAGQPAGYEEQTEEAAKQKTARRVSDYDDIFYEDEKEKGQEPDENHGFVLLLTSSDSDLRIQMVNSSGEMPEDMGWTAEADRAGGDIYEAADDDGDGIIYMGEVTPGDYTVEVTNGRGITETSSITVKPKLKYTASSGIRSIIMQEDEIDAATEDTASDPDEREAEAESQGEGTAEGNALLPQGTLGIDVSKYNKEIDWNRVKASGIEFAIIRAGYRGSSTGVLVEDPYFRINLAGAKAAGLKTGVYFFTQAVTPEEAGEEAEAVAALVNSSDLALPVFLDVESSGNANGGRADGLDTAARTEIVRTFCERAEELGYKAGVYANKTWMTKRLNMDALQPYTKWLAQYRASGPTYDGDYSIWQYTSSGHVDGISGRVDLDIFIENN